MLHRKTLIIAVNNFNLSPIEKAYIQEQLEKINDEFISRGIMNAILEDAMLEEKKAYDIEGNFIDTVVYQCSTGKILTYGEGFKEYKKEGYDLKILHNSDVVLLIPKK